jgi:hypothetical protein
MNAILFCTSYIKDEAAWYRRYQHWLRHYSSMDLGADRLLLIDDCSPFTPVGVKVHNIGTHSPLPGDRQLILRFHDRLGRSGLLSYPGWWRSFLHALNVAKELGADKIIHIESDAFILSEELAKHIRSIQSGWTTLWSNHYRIPETAIQVICEDQFSAMESFKNMPLEELAGKFAEKILPFTEVDKQFKGDRYGDIRSNRWIFRSRRFQHWPIFEHDFFWAKVPADADFAAQVTDRLWRNSPILRTNSLVHPAVIGR